MFCMHCGREVDPTQKFCSTCGTPVQQPVPTVSAVYTVPVTAQKPVDRPSALGRRRMITDIVVPLVMILLILFVLRFFEFGTLELTVKKDQSFRSQTATYQIPPINEWVAFGEPVLFGILTFTSITFCVLPLFVNSVPKRRLLIPTIITAVWCFSLVVLFVYLFIVIMPEIIDSRIDILSHIASVSGSYSFHFIPNAVSVLFIILTVVLLVYPFFLLAPIKRGEYS